MKQRYSHRSRSTKNSGFTLPELLIAATLLALFVGIAASISTSILRGDLRLTQTIALRDNWNKISQLINADIQEACSASVASNVLTLRVLPTPETTSNTCAANATTITYRVVGTSLQRNGPRVRSDGTLSFQGVSSSGSFLSTADQVLSEDVSAFTPSIPTGSSFYPTFTLTMTRNGVSYSGATATNASPDGRTRVRSFNS